ncbi:hypothetical protein [Saccharothrix sp. HUAS TT1]|uniref:hypothetical protein n=1 Tax=unclassified Saccharothrix TaxID=2593673 RepID=UPI00345C46F1
MSIEDQHRHVPVDPATHGPPVAEEGRHRAPLRPRFGPPPVAPEGMPLGVHVVYGPNGWGKTHLLATTAERLDRNAHQRRLPWHDRVEVWAFDGRGRPPSWRGELTQPPRTAWIDLDDLVEELRLRLVPEHPRAHAPLLVLLDHLDVGRDGLTRPSLLGTLLALTEMTARPIGVMVCTRTLAAFGEGHDVDLLLAGSTLTQVARFSLAAGR